MQCHFALQRVQSLLQQGATQPALQAVKKLFMATPSAVKQTPVWPRTLWTIRQIAAQLEKEGQPATAATLLIDVLDKCDDKSIGVLGLVSVLQRILGAQGKFAEAELLARHWLPNFRAVLGETHSETLSVINCLSNDLLQQMLWFFFSPGWPLYME